MFTISKYFLVFLIQFLFVKTDFTRNYPQNVSHFEPGWSNSGSLIGRDLSDSNCDQISFGATWISQSQRISSPQLFLFKWGVCLRNSSSAYNIRVTLFMSHTAGSISVSLAHNQLPKVYQRIDRSLGFSPFVETQDFDFWNTRIDDPFQHVAVIVNVTLNCTITCAKLSISTTEQCSNCECQNIVTSGFVNSGSINSGSATSYSVTSGSPTTNSVTFASGDTTTGYSSNVGSPQQGGNRTALFGGVIGSIVLVIIVAVILVVVYRRKRENKNFKQATDLEAYRSSKTGSVNTGRNSVDIDLNLTGIEIKRKLGSGNFGEVYEGIWNGTSQVACKKLKAEEGGLDNEIKLLVKLNHPNVVRMWGTFQTPDTCYLVMEFIPKGSLVDFLRKKEIRRELTTIDLIKMCLDACSGLLYLEQKGIVHRDVAARNLLVAEGDGKFIVKVSDLGLSRETGGNYYQSTDTVFPVKWSPPEVIEHRQYTSKSDVWMYAVTMWEIFEFGKVPYSEMSNRETMQYVLGGGRLEKPENCPNEVFEMIKKCWSHDPEARPSFRDIYNTLHTLYKPVEDAEESKEQEENVYNNSIYGQNKLANYGKRGELEYNNQN